jgi:omega-3 fatty acid desaturase (delta-15 desaturase)
MATSFFPSISISEIKNSIPKHCFISNLKLSLMYMFIDMSILATSIFTYNYIKNEGLLLHLIYWNIYGFFAWSLFVIGHDCGHGSFSKYPIINSICGHLCHSVLLVPYYPWARSHHFHHLYHNCKDKDKSYTWMFKEDYDKIPLVIKYLVTGITGPFILFWIYLSIGTQDGSHFIWFGKLYENTSIIEKCKSIISISSVMLWIYIVYDYTGSFIEFFSMYGGIIVFCYFWLFMVTWFQHHSEDTLVYNNVTWTYIKGAFQTNDHLIGYKIDELHHHISDCHLVHHIFFREIPHYNLKEATNALYTYLIDQDKEYLIKKVNHTQFPLKYIYDFFKMFFKIGMTKLDIY